MTKAEIIADSISPQGHRITTFVVTFWRGMLSELNTHRMFSRNSASCLSGDTVITVEKPSLLKRGNKSKHTKMTIKEIVDKWFDGDSKGRDMKGRLKSMNLRCLNENTGEFTTTNITNCFRQGIQDLYEIELENGYKIKCTENHRLFTEDSWQTLSTMGLKVLDSGIVCWNENAPKLATNGLPLNEFVINHEGLKLKCDEIGKPKSNGNSLVVKYSKIKSIKYVGKNETFDIEVDAPYHNFIANGIVVHNSRAIPFNKMVQMVEENPFIPIAWQRNHSGMQGTEYYTNEEVLKCGIIEQWLGARDMAVNRAIALNELGVTKQLCNRLLEPFMYHTAIITATELDNFFKLRCPSYTFEGDSFGIEYRTKKEALSHGWTPNDEKEILTDLDWLSINKSQAEIHIQALAEAMLDALNDSIPKKLKAGEWHVPFGDNINPPQMFTKEGLEEFKVKIAVARCARISYQTLGDNPKIDYEADIRLHDILKENGHASPFEHCARVMSDDEYYSFSIGQDGQKDHQHGWCRNFRGFTQYRHLIEI